MGRRGSGPIFRTSVKEFAAIFPLCQSSCRLDISVTLGALRNDSGSIQRRIQKESSDTNVLISELEF